MREEKVSALIEYIKERLDWLYKESLEELKSYALEVFRMTD